MIVFHTSDLHIGLKLYNRDLHDDQQYVLKQIVEAAEKQQPDVMVIAGDVYDKAVPSAEAVELFDEFVSELAEAAPEMQIMIISGNHDSAPRLNLFRNILKRQNVHMIGEPPQNEDEHIEKITLQDDAGNVNFYLLPFVKPSAVKRIVGSDENGNNLSYNDTLHKLIERESIDASERNVLVSHQFYLPISADAQQVERMDSEIRTVGNIDEVRADVLEQFDYAALGHIHKPMSVGGEFHRYSGTPLPYSVSEAGQQKGIVAVDLAEKGSVSTSVVPLEPLHEIRVISGTLEEVLRQGCDDYVSIALTDEADLDVLDMQDRLRCAFPNLLEIRRENAAHVDHSDIDLTQSDLDPFELCCTFLKDLDDGEKDILKDAVNAVQGGA